MSTTSQHGDDPLGEDQSHEDTVGNGRSVPLIPSLEAIDI